MFLFILYFFIAPACAVTAECFSKEHPLGMLIMLGSLQQLHTGLKERGRERKRAFHIHSKLKEAEREWTRENEREGTEREVENKKGCSKKKRTSGADFNTPLKLFICRGSGLEAEEILCLWKYSGTSLNCSNFFFLFKCTMYPCDSPSWLLCDSSHSSLSYSVAQFED